jgi:hypothetical protein
VIPADRRLIPASLRFEPSNAKPAIRALVPPCLNK